MLHQGQVNEIISVFDWHGQSFAYRQFRRLRRQALRGNGTLQLTLSQVRVQRRVTTFASTGNSKSDLLGQNQWKPVSSCPLCGGLDFRSVTEARDRHYGNPGVFSVVACSACGLYFLNPMPTLDYLSNAYPTNYYSYAPPDPEIKRPGLAKRSERRSAIYFCIIPVRPRDPKFKSPGIILDIGCGSGKFLASMRDKGWTAYRGGTRRHSCRTRSKYGAEYFWGNDLCCRVSR